MNITTVLGVIFGIIILGWAILSSTGDAGVFLNHHGIAIVGGGVFAATLICYPLKDVLRVVGGLRWVLRREDLPVASYLEGIHAIAKQMLAKGTAQLERELEGVENSFLQDALRMVVDQYPHDRIRTILETTAENVREALLAEAGMFRTMAKMAPAFGLVGTLIGLIVMFQNMDQASSIGPAMAVAMTATFYGVILANLFFLPVAVKMERHIDQRVLLMRMITEGVLLVAKKTPPDLVVDELKAFLPPRKWAMIKLKDS